MKKGKFVNKTLDYYNTNAQEYFSKTINVDMVDKYSRFLKYLPKESNILDFGCGSGRDSLFFIKNGYKVTAVDGCKQLCKLASRYIGQSVKNIDFLDFNSVNTFDGIWACASLLHVDKETFLKILKNLFTSLKENGVIYLSLKLGADYSSYEGDRFFTYYSEETLYNLLKEIKLSVLEDFRTNDVLNRDIQWINLILRK